MAWSRDHPQGWLLGVIQKTLVGSPNKGFLLRAAASALPPRQRASGIAQALGLKRPLAQPLAAH